MTSSACSFKLFLTSIKIFSNVIASESSRPCLMLWRRTLLIHPNRTFALNFKTRILGQYMSKDSFNYNFISTPKNNLSNLRWFGRKCIKQECWKCGTAIELDMNQYFCICGVVQPPLRNRSYFQIFGIEEKFDINLNHLSAKYHELETLFDPDRYSWKSKDFLKIREEKHLLEEHKGMVNSAYINLRCPLKRGLYMLRSNYRILNEETQIHSFRIEAYGLEDLVRISNHENLRKIEKSNSKNIEELLNNISKCFESGDAKTAKVNLKKLELLKSVSYEINYRFKYH